VGHNAVQEMMEILGYGKFFPVGFPVCLQVQRNPKMAGNCSPIQPTVRIWLPQTTTCSCPWMITWGYWGGGQEVVRSWLWGAGTAFYRGGIFKILQRWQECINRDGNFCSKVIKDAQILLTSFVSVCVPSFHCRINVLISFDTPLVHCS
jgi:hypothetical protein